MNRPKLAPVPVSDEMIAAGTAVLARSKKLSAEDLVVSIYRAMTSARSDALAVTMVPVYATRALNDPTLPDGAFEFVPPLPPAKARTPGTKKAPARR